MRRISSAALVVVSSAAPACAQTIQAWPEISVFTKPNDRMRFYFLATTVKESRESTEGEFGPNFDFYLRPFTVKSVHRSGGSSKSSQLRGIDTLAPGRARGETAQTEVFVRLFLR